MKAKEFDRLVFTPFHTSKILHYFLSGAQSINENGLKTELIYLALPLIYNELFSYKLSMLRKDSKLASFLNANKNLQVFLSQINVKIKDYKNATKEAILILNATSPLSIGEMTKCKNVADYKIEEDSELRDTYKAAYHLGLILAKERYLTIFLNLRITEI